MTDQCPISGSPIPSDRIQSDSPVKRDSLADCPESPAKLGINYKAPIWDQRPSRYDMSYPLRANDDYKDLAAVANAIINVKPE